MLMLPVPGPHFEQNLSTWSSVPSWKATEEKKKKKNSLGLQALSILPLKQILSLSIYSYTTLCSAFLLKGGQKHLVTMQTLP